MFGSSDLLLRTFQESFDRCKDVPSSKYFFFGWPFTIGTLINRSGGIPKNFSAESSMLKKFHNFLVIFLEIQFKFAEELRASLEIKFI